MTTNSSVAVRATARRNRHSPRYVVQSHIPALNVLVVCRPIRVFWGYRQLNLQTTEQENSVIDWEQSNGRIGFIICYLDAVLCRSKGG